MYLCKPNAAYLALLMAAWCIPAIHAQDRKIDPTWIYRDTLTAAEKPSDITTATCHYKPLFGQGAEVKFAVSGVVRYGEAVVDPGGACASVQYPEEDQIDVVLDGNGSLQYGDQVVPLKKEDYIYIPSKLAHALKNTSGAPFTVVIMGYNIAGYPPAPMPPAPLKANIEDVPTEHVNGHPETALFRLLLGDLDSKRDRIEAGHAVTSLFLMEIAPGGTNFPHHHQREEEIYLLLSGHGTIVAGGGTDGIAGRRPAKPGDAYFYRQNAEVGYYSAPGVASRVLCVRNLYPGMARSDVPQKSAAPRAEK